MQSIKWKITKVSSVTEMTIEKLTVKAKEEA